jgi:hypothetical protein
MARRGMTHAIDATLPPRDVPANDGLLAWVRRPQYHITCIRWKHSPAVAQVVHWLT